MKIKDLISVVANDSEFNIISQSVDEVYIGTVAHLPSRLFERTVKVLHAHEDEFYILLEG